MQFAAPFLSDSFYGNIGVSAGTPIPNTPGNWVQLAASISEDCAGLILTSPISGTSFSNKDTSTVIEIGLGEAGSEVLHASFLIGGHSSISTGLPFCFVPGFIPAGARVSIRSRSATANKFIQFVGVSFIPVVGDIPPAPTTIGIQTETARGVTLGLANVWTEIVAATPVDLNYLFPYIQFSTINASIGAGADTIDIGMGEEGSEEIIIAGIKVRTTTAEAMTIETPLVYPFAIPIPAGSRLVARHSINQDTFTNISLIGV